MPSNSVLSHICSSIALDSGVLAASPGKIDTADEELASRVVHKRQWPKPPTEAAARKAFPTAIHVWIPVAGERFAGDAVVLFESVDAAKNAMIKGARVGGRGLKVTWGGAPRCPIANCGSTLSEQYIHLRILVQFVLGFDPSLHCRRR